MRLYIAEKPSLGRAIAEVLPKPQRKQEGCIWLANGDCISWCIGHLLEQAEPHHYDPAYQRWQLQHLPIIPEQWLLRPKAKTQKQLKLLKQLIKQADELVHAGDPDREGQLLVDQVFDYAHIPKTKKDAALRCLISDLNPAAVKRALSQMRSNRDFIPLSTSALARSRADWLYGINMTRAYTIQGRSIGYQGVLSVGRVQTPVLGLVVHRDKEIENFVSKPFYEVLALLQTREGREFRAKWQPSEACHPYMDEEGRVLLKALAENVVARIIDKPALVDRIEHKAKTQAPPLPFNLSALQIDAARRFGMNAKQVLDCCQNLYERHKLITYPRSDSRHLPAEHFSQAPAVIKAIAHNAGIVENSPPDTPGDSLYSAAIRANIKLKSKAWNDNKVDAHHAIVPTHKSIQQNALTSQESKLYRLIARQYLCQFYPKFAYTDTRVELLIEKGRFIATARQVQDPGWKILFQKAEKPEQAAEPSQQQPAPQNLPPLTKGEQLHCLRGELVEKQTQPPKHFTDATLLAAMTGIARFVRAPDIRQILKDTDGLGTEATRAGILELLFIRGFLIRNNKNIISTAAGRGLIDSLPQVAITPDMTAQWETALNRISTRQVSYRDFIEPMHAALQDLIDQSKNTLPTKLKGVKAPVPKFKKNASKRASSKNRKHRLQKVKKAP